MKKVKKVTSALLAIAVLALPTNSFRVNAATDYAYSIGVNFGTTGSLTGDFTQNVLYANTCYGMISGISSYYNLLPDQSYMKGNNPNGVRRIGSKVVFLNSHANQHSIVFDQNNSGGIYYTGVYDGKDTSQFVGLQSTNMSGVDLISFVGCSTGATTSSDSNNLPSRAVQMGAESAVGFKDSIHSRFLNGPDWLKRYNDALTNGYTISDAIAYATSCYPNSDLGKYAVVYGSSNNRIAYNGSVNSISNSEEEEEIELYTQYVDIPLSCLESTDVMPCEELGDSYSLLLDSIKDFDVSFEPNDYSVYVNMLSEDDDNGMVVFTYQIDDMIDTNYAVVASIVGGEVTSITKNFEEKPVADEQDLMNRIATHPSAISNEEYANTLNIDTNDIVSEGEHYLYDYRTGKLIYEKTLDYVENNTGVIVDNSYSVEV